MVIFTILSFLILLGIWTKTLMLEEGGERGSLPLSCFNCPIHLMFVIIVFQMIDSLTEKLEKRETQLLSTSKEKARLEEAYDNLKE